MPFYGDLQGEIDQITQRQQAREMAAAQARTVNAAQVSRANNIQRNYKWMPAGTSLAFAKAGIDDDTIQRIASKTLTAKSQNTALGLNEPGDIVNAATEAKRAKAEWIQQHEGTNPLSKAVKPLGGIVGGALGFAGGHAINAVATGDNPFANTLRGTTRNVSALFDLPMQTVQGAYRDTSQQIKDKGWGSLITGEGLPQSAEEAANRPGFVGQTDVGQTISSLFHGGGLNQGSGFFVGDKSGVADARREAQGKYGYVIEPDGTKHVRSIGRDFAGLMYEPGSSGYNRLSGVADAAVAIGADLPFNWVTGASKAAKSFKAIGEGVEYGDEVGRLAKMRDSLGMIFNPGSRETYSPQVLDNWLSMKRGIKTAEEFAGYDATEIYNASRKNMPSELVQKFANAKTPDEVREVFRANLGQGIDSVPTRALSKYGVTLKNTYMPEVMQRMVNRLPSEAWWDADNPDEVLTQFDRQLDAMLMPADQKPEFFNRMAMIEHKQGDRATWNLRKKVYTDALDNTVDRITLKQMDTTGLEGIDVLKADTKKGTYLNDVGEVTPMTTEQKARIQEIRAKQKQIREVFNPLKQGRYKDDVIFDMDNLSLWQGTVAGERRMVSAGAQSREAFELIGDPYNVREGKVRFFRGEDSAWSTPNFDKAKELLGDDPVYHVDFNADEIKNMEVAGYGPGDLFNVDGHDIANMQREGNAPHIEAMLEQGLEGGHYKLGEGNDPWLMAEFHGRMMPTPDWDLVHKELSSIGPMLNAQGNVAPTQWMHNVQEKFWKPLVVLRPAAALRIIGETQAGLWASGLANIYTHPIQLISMMLADTKLGERFGLTRGLKTGVLGNEIVDAGGVQKVMGINNIYTNRHGASIADLMTRIEKGERGYHEAVFHEVNMFRKEVDDPLPAMIADALANDKPLSTVEEQVWKMEDYRKQLQSVAPAREAGDNFQPLMDRRGSDAYVRRLKTRMDEMTGRDPTLLQEIIDPQMSRDQLIDHIKGMDQDQLRDIVHGPRALTAKQRKGGDGVVGWLFGNLIQRPVHAMSEEPAIRQAYWKEIKAVAPLMDPEHATELLASAEKAGLKQSELRQLSYFANKPVANAENALSLAQVDEIGNTASVKQLQRLFEDHVAKRRGIDAIGLLSPFAHVWAESLGRWTRFMAEDPELLHQLGYGFRAATNPDVAEAVGGSVMGVPKGRGFLYPDENGAERFAYPMSAQMMKHFSGVDAPLTGSLQGLSMGFDIVPGVGPIASVPLAGVIPKTPEWDAVRDVVFPYGKPKSLLDLKEQMPAWMRRAGAPIGFEDDRTMAATTMDIMRTKMASGEFDIHNPDPVVADAEGKRLLAESRKSATQFTVLRGIAGAISPSAPAPEWYLDDKTGKRVMLKTMSDDWKAMYDEDPQHAVLNFMDRYGDNAMLAIAGKTISVALGGGLPPTKAAEQWTRGEAKGIADDLPLAYGFFAPRDPDAKLDFSVYDRQIAKGERTQFTPEQFLQESNKRVAQTMYYAARNELPANMNVKQSAIMRGLRDDLSARFPGYESKFGEDIVGVPAQASVGQTIEQLTTALGDYRLKDNPATKTLADYLNVRAQIRTASAAKLTDGDSWTTSKKGAKSRASLYELGSRLARENKAFAPMWESVLYREFQSDFEADQGIKG